MVIPVKKVGDSGGLIAARMQGAVDGEVEYEGSAAIRAHAPCIVPVGVLLGVYVIPPRIGEFCTR